MKFLRTVRNYLFYCGIEKNEYKELKKDAYVSNFEVWRVLHCMMIAVFALLLILSLRIDVLAVNRMFYLIALIYSIFAAVLFFFVFKKDSLIAQLVIYLSISLMFVFAGFITQNHPDIPATAFVVFLIISPMFMIDKPYFMGFVLSAASIIFLIWMHGVKPYEIWKIDAYNVVVFAIAGFFIHVLANSIRIKEFVLSRKITVQNNTDDLTGLKNKRAITKAINEYLEDDSKDKGIMFLLDIDHFKSINDTYGHDIGDSVINQLGIFFGEIFTDGEIVGRFGGDEFIVFIKDTNDTAVAENVANKIVDGAAEHIVLPDKNQKISISAGIAIYNGLEKNYSEIFKKADIALYKIKSDRTVKYNIYIEPVRESDRQI